MNMIAFSQTDNQSLIELQGVTKVYGTGQAAMHALRGIDLRIDEGEFRGGDGTKRFGQVHLHEHPRLSGYANRGGL